MSPFQNPPPEPTTPQSASRRSLIVQVQGEDIELLPEKAFYWKTKSILGFSDVHLGKAESYQAAGIPMPSGAHLDDLQAITLLIERYQPNTVLILGDWIHQRTSWTDQIKNDLQLFFEKHRAQTWILMRGNHETGSVETLKDFPIEIVADELVIAPFTFSHGHGHGHGQPPPASPSKPFYIQGHIHPAVRLREGSTSIRLPAFVLQKNTLILPAFGSQTGGFEMKLARADRAFPTTGTSVFELK